MRFVAKILGAVCIVLAIIALAPLLLQNLPWTFRLKIGAVGLVTALLFIAWDKLVEAIADELQERKKHRLFIQAQAEQNKLRRARAHQLPRHGEPGKQPDAEKAAAPQALVRDTQRWGHLTFAATDASAGDALPEPDKRLANARNALRQTFLALEGSESDTVSSAREAMRAALPGQEKDDLLAALAALACGLFALAEGEIKRKPEDTDLLNLGLLLKRLDGEAVLAAVIPQGGTLPSSLPEQFDLERTRTKLILACYGLAQAVINGNRIAPVLRSCALALLAVLIARRDDSTLPPAACGGIKELAVLVFPTTVLLGHDK